MTEPVTTTQDEAVWTITVDDGKANALSASVLASIGEALDAAVAGHAGAIVLAGRTGMFSGGFDLRVMRGGDLGAIAGLVTTGGELILRIYSSPVPIVAACTGHAVAAGALTLLGSHYRVGAAGAFQIGLIESAIGMVLPDWGILLAAERLVPTHLQQAAIEARIYGPEDAATAGFLDRVVPPDQVAAVAHEEARRLAALDGGAYGGNAAKVRGPGIAKLAASLEADRLVVASLS